MKARFSVQRALFLYAVWFGGAPSSSSAPTLAVKDFVVREVARVPSTSIQLLAAVSAAGTVFYVADGRKVLRIDGGKDPVSLAEFPSGVRQLGHLPVSGPSGIFVLTDAGHGYALAPSGKATRITRSETATFRYVAFTSLPLYHKKPHGIVWKGGRGFVCRLAWSPPAAGTSVSSLRIEEQLSLFWKQIAWLDFCETPGNWGLLGLDEKGSLWRIDSLGAVMPWVASPSLAGANSFAVDHRGVLGGGVFVSVPAAGDIWQLDVQKKFRRFARKLNETTGYQGWISMGEDGALYVLAGTKIMAIEPPAGSALQKSAAAMGKAERLAEAGAWREAEIEASTALKGLKRPVYWVNRIKEFRRACQGAAKLERLRQLAVQRGYAGLLATARALERSYGTTSWLATDLAYVRKQCEVAGSVVILADFEDQVAVSQGFKLPGCEVTGSVKRRAAAPEPVKEGAYSVKWIVPAQSGTLRTLAFRSDQWGPVENFSSFSLWVYSSRDRYELTLRTLNAANVEIATYSPRLKRGWQQFVRPPVSLRLEQWPADMTLAGVILEAASPGSNDIYVDDVRLIGTRRRR